MFLKKLSARDFVTLKRNCEKGEWGAKLYQEHLYNYHSCACNAV